MDKLLVFFDEINKDDIALVGGKGANLGEMTLSNFPVPFGFCITTEGYKLFIQKNNLNNFLSDMSKSLNFDNVYKLAPDIRKKIIESNMPKLLEEEIIKALKKTGIEDFYAVRSSATAEDLAFASFAGQQDTYLNIKGSENILNSIKQCIASLFTDRAILYRLKNKIENESILMSVVVQKMVKPQVSGIMFTADPVSFNRNIISIDASFGLGEALVSGLVSPDIYKFNKRKNSIESKIINEKKIAIISDENYGTHKIDISEDKSKVQVLNDDDIVKLSSLGMNIENHYGSPQDIEWCKEDGDFYIVQSRNITSLYPIPIPKPLDKDPHVYISVNHVQVMTDTISPLGIDIFCNMLNPSKEGRLIGHCSFFCSSGGRIYIDFNNLLKLKVIGNKFPYLLANVDSLMSKSIIEVIKRDEFKPIVGKQFLNPKFVFKHGIPAIFKVIGSLFFKDTKNYGKYMLDYIYKKEKNILDKVNSANSDLERVNLICEYGNVLDTLEQRIIPYVAPGILSMKALQHMEEKYLGTSNYVIEISKGLKGNVTTEMTLELGDLADIVRKSGVLIKEFENEDYKSLNSRIKALDGQDQFKKMYFSFLDKYGSRSSGEIDVARERWVENPIQLAKTIVSTVKTSKDGVHRIEYEKTIEKALQYSDEFITLIREKAGKIKAKLAKRLIEVLRDCLPLREHHKLMMVRLFYDFKLDFLSIGKSMVLKAHLLNDHDIFYLRVAEIRDYLKDNKSMVELVKIRKEEYDHFNTLTPPKVITSDGEEIKFSHSIKDLPKNAIVGIPVSSGVVEGIAKVILDPTKDSLNKGEILVAPFTDPGWTPFFVNAAGLVMEIGGLLTHGTVVAREYGIPAIVNVTDATKIIKTGQNVKIDGNTGVIIIG